MLNITRKIKAEITLKLLLENIKESKKMQEKLFQIIKEKYKNKEKLVSDLMKILNVGRSAVYKRLSGNILLNSVEVDELIQHFNIDTYLLFGKKEGTVSFQFPPLFKNVDNQNNFLTPIIEDLIRLRKLPDSTIKFLATGFPIFYFFLNKEIAHFKFYIFKNSVWDKASFNIRKFSIREIETDFERIAQYESVKKLYASVNSEEVWTGNIYQTTFEEIKIYLEAGLFDNPEDALALIDAMMKTTNQIHEMVRVGNKSLMSGAPIEATGKLKVFYSNFGKYGSNILTNSTEGNKVYSTYDLPNYMMCEDEDFVAYTDSWMDKIKNKSLPLSASSDLEKLKFFNKIRDYITTCRGELEEMIFKLNPK